MSKMKPIERTARGQPTEFPDLRLILDNMDPQDYVAWPLKNPEDKVTYPSWKGKSIHPALHCVRNYGTYWKKRFHAFQDGATLYIIRLKDKQ